MYVDVLFLFNKGKIFMDLRIFCEITSNLIFSRTIFALETLQLGSQIDMSFSFELLIETFINM